MLSSASCFDSWNRYLLLRQILDHLQFDPQICGCLLYTSNDDISKPLSEANVIAIDTYPQDIYMLYPLLGKVAKDKLTQKKRLSILVFTNKTNLILSITAVSYTHLINDTHKGCQGFHAGFSDKLWCIRKKLYADKAGWQRTCRHLQPFDSHGRTAPVSYTHLLCDINSKQRRQLIQRIEINKRQHLK